MSTRKTLEVVAILGASAKPDRYAYVAMKLLEEKGHQVLLISPGVSTIEGRPVLKSIKEIQSPVDTLTLYVNPTISTAQTQEILNLKPKRVIFNPGTENEPLARQLAEAGINSEEACTLVLLRTNQF